VAGKIRQAHRDGATTITTLMASTANDHPGWSVQAIGSGVSQPSRTNLTGGRSRHGHRGLGVLAAWRQPPVNSRRRCRMLFTGSRSTSQEEGRSSRPQRGEDHIRPQSPKGQRHRLWLARTRKHGERYRAPLVKCTGEACSAPCVLTLPRVRCANGLPRQPLSLLHLLVVSKTYP